MIVTSGNRKTIGNKAFDLYRCRLLGVKVPGFFVVTSGCYRKFSRKRISLELKQQLRQTLKQLGCHVAVRSSSVLEDTSDSSAAGRFTTVLGVKTLPDLIKAVRSVWDSAEGGDMAVIIQKQLEPERAGVLFTRNPANGNPETVIEYVQGLGDKLVSGRSEPVRLIFPSKGPFNEFKNLVGISHKLEYNFGYPLDIEWAFSDNKFYILQARPITKLPPPGRTTGITYSRVQAEQFYSGPVSPLFYSFFKLLHSKYYIQETMDAVGIDLSLEEGLVRHKSYLYMDTGLAEYVITHIPLRGSRELLEEVFPDDMKEELRKRSKGADPVVIFRLLKFIIRNPRLWIWNLDKHFSEEVVPSIYAKLDGIKDFDRMDLDQLKEAYLKIMDCAILHIRTSKWGLALYLPPLIGAVNSFIEKNGIDEKYLSALMSGLPVNKTLEASTELKQLAKLIRADPGAVSIVEKTSNDYQTLKLALLSETKGELIIDYFESILKRYGHRRLSRDLLSPSWNDEPEIPLAILSKMVCDNKLDLSDTKRLSVERRISAEQAVKNQLPFRKRRRFGTISKYLVRYLTFREYQRFYLDMIISKMRQLVLEVGRRMVADKVLNKFDDVFFIDLSDIQDFFEDVKDHKLSRKAKFQRITFENECGTPGRFLRRNVDFDMQGSLQEERIFNLPGKVIIGQAVSPGFFRGTVRVLPSIDKNVELERNDIIVTKCIDPGQTHVFPLAGALIFESGGMLSHGAILAREFSLPTVASIKNATSIFKNGQRISVNGTKGEVVLEGS